MYLYVYPSRAAGDTYEYMSPPPSAPRPLHIQIRRIELRGPLQRLQVHDRHPAAAKLDDAHLAQLLEHAVEVHRGEAEGFGEVRLGQGQMVARLVRPPDDP